MLQIQLSLKFFQIDEGIQRELLAGVQSEPPGHLVLFKDVRNLRGEFHDGLFAFAQQCVARNCGRDLDNDRCLVADFQFQLISETAADGEPLTGGLDSSQLPERRIDTIDIDMARPARVLGLDLAGLHTAGHDDGRGDGGNVGFPGGGQFRSEILPKKTWPLDDEVDPAQPLQRHILQASPDRVANDQRPRDDSCRKCYAEYDSEARPEEVPKSFKPEALTGEHKQRMAGVVRWSRSLYLASTSENRLASTLTPLTSMTTTHFRVA